MSDPIWTSDPPIIAGVYWLKHSTTREEGRGSAYELRWDDHNREWWVSYKASWASWALGGTLRSVSPIESCEALAALRERAAEAEGLLAHVKDVQTAHGDLELVFCAEQNARAALAARVAELEAGLRHAMLHGQALRAGTCAACREVVALLAASAKGEQRQESESEQSQGGALGRTPQKAPDHNGE